MPVPNDCFKMSILDVTFLLLYLPNVLSPHVEMLSVRWQRIAACLPKFLWYRAFIAHMVLHHLCQPTFPIIHIMPNQFLKLMGKNANVSVFSVKAFLYKEYSIVSLLL